MTWLTHYLIPSVQSRASSMTEHMLTLLACRLTELRRSSGSAAPASGWATATRSLASIAAGSSGCWRCVPGIVHACSAQLCSPALASSACLQGTPRWHQLVPLALHQCPAVATAHSMQLAASHTQRSLSKQVHGASTSIPSPAHGGRKVMQRAAHVCCHGEGGRIATVPDPHACLVRMRA